MAEKKESKSYRQLEEELDMVLQRVEHASYEDLDDLLKDYDTGTKLIEQLEKRLEAAKNTIKKAQK